ncbi:alanyl-tRNA editing protein Aarsd1-like, partial [Pecten maximus]|uniref:alanyl-tRNA editing protein Aarsd1-like n=1 Tax=Pecten maximus TaxID=6579 RepID=UPI001457F819
KDQPREPCKRLFTPGRPRDHTCVRRPLFLTEPVYLYFKSKVKSCIPAESTLVTNGKKDKVKGFEVILEDTILFPEGGGQPDDRGTINNIDVLRITRKGAEAVNFVTTEIAADTDVDMKVDWSRRFDHMQQHTGQHLITAVAEQLFGCPTTSWCLGEKTSFIELDIPNMKEEDVVKLEETVNEKILAEIPVTPHVFEDKNDPKLKEVNKTLLNNLKHIVTNGYMSHITCLHYK